MSASVTRADVDRALAVCRDHWWSHLHTCDGVRGWYRELRRNDLVGIVASAQAIDVLAPAWPDDRLDDLGAVASGIAGAQTETGMFPFISTLDDVDVIDSTAWVILAFVRVPEEIDDGHLLRTASATACSALRRAQLERGGWGIATGGEFRVYSTAVALRALLVAEGVDEAVESAAAALIDRQDQASGAWADAEGRLSAAVTATAARSLLGLGEADGVDRPCVKRSVEWLRGVAQQSGCWTTGPWVHASEKVELRTGNRLRRVEYSLAALPVAVTTLCAAGRFTDPSVVEGASVLVRAVLDGGWSRLVPGASEVPPSWLVHDVTEALQVVQRELEQADADEVWTERGRVGFHAAAHRPLRRWFGRRWRQAAWALTVPLLVFVLVRTGAVGAPGWGAVWVLLGLLVIAVLGNALYAYVDDRRRR